MASSSSSSSSPFPIIPAPWAAKGEAFFTFLTVPSYPPPGGYHPLESSSPAFSSPSLSGAFTGGLGSAMIIRYTEGTGGPYDEIMINPGFFKVPESCGLPGITGKKKDQKHLRVARIYVSTVQSVFNGRRNWGIAKHLARFKFDRTDGGNTTVVSVYDPLTGPQGFKIEGGEIQEGEKPFFRAEFKKVAYHPTVTVNTEWIPEAVFDLTLYNPPNPQSGEWEVDGEVGTKEWKTCKAGIKGRMTGCWTRGLLEEEEGGEGKEEKWGDGVGFPDVKFWRYATWLRDVEFTFPESMEVVREGEGKKVK